jgi:hypothetical protein
MGINSKTHTHKKSKLRMFGDCKNSLRVTDTYIRFQRRKAMGRYLTMATHSSAYYELSLSLSPQTNETFIYGPM